MRCQLFGLVLYISGTSAQDYCDVCGNSASYEETIDTSSTIQTRTIVSNGCPNHVCLCTGKEGTSGCGAVGEEGTGTEAQVQDYEWVIPAKPVIASEVTDVSCQTDDVAVALNGVPIYTGAVDSDCDSSTMEGILDVTDEDAEWTSFDYCGGHARNLPNLEVVGDYHYHFPPSCLETQIVDTVEQTAAFAAGHSPQIGWSLDGFPIYGPFTVDGLATSHTSQGCTGDYCLDDCGGLQMELPEVDNFKYRYYMAGPLSDLVSLPTDPKPAESDYPFSLNCYRGCTYDELVNGDSKCGEVGTGTTSDYAVTVTAGYAEVFISEAAIAAGMQCANGTSDATEEDGPGGDDDENSINEASTSTAATFGMFLATFGIAYAAHRQ
jgi:hypothetical protein